MVRFPLKAFSVETGLTDCQAGFRGAYPWIVEAGRMRTPQIECLAVRFRVDYNDGESDVGGK